MSQYKDFYKSKMEKQLKLYHAAVENGDDKEQRRLEKEIMTYEKQLKGVK